MYCTMRKLVYYVLIIYFLHPLHSILFNSSIYIYIYSTLLSTLLYCTLLYSTLLYPTPLHSTLYTFIPTLYPTLLYSTIHYYSLFFL